MYILELKENKFFVGCADNVSSEFFKHKGGLMNNTWTIKYPPIRIIKKQKVPLIYKYFEVEKITLDLMEK